MGLTRDELKVELQVRTIFEEAWSEIDHTLNYPHGSSPVMSEFMQHLNRLSGAADEMGQFAFALREADRQKDAEIALLREQLSELQVAAESSESSVAAMPGGTPADPADGQTSGQNPTPGVAVPAPAQLAVAAGEVSAQDTFAHVMSQLRNPAQESIEKILRVTQALERASNPTLDAIIRLNKQFNPSYLQMIEQLTPRQPRTAGRLNAVAAAQQRADRLLGRKR